jgi:hypothetical protein
MTQEKEIVQEEAPVVQYDLADLTFLEVLC